MAYSQSLADRVRQALQGRRGVADKKMFGGLGFLLHGNMLLGVWQQSLIVRLGPEQAERALKLPHVREFDITGRPMRGWVMVEPDGLDRDADLRDWIEQSWSFVETLPAKS